MPIDDGARTRTLGVLPNGVWIFLVGWLSLAGVVHLDLWRRADDEPLMATRHLAVLMRTTPSVGWICTRQHIWWAMKWSEPTCLNSQVQVLLKNK